MIVKDANEMGYFPTNAQAKRISARAGKLYCVAVGRGNENPINREKFKEANGAAIKQVMEAEATGKTSPPKETANRESSIIARANELGYFPTNEQAVRIDRMSRRMCQVFGPMSPGDGVDLKKWDDGSIEQVMEEDADRRVGDPRQVFLSEEPKSNM